VSNRKFSKLQQHQRRRSSTGVPWSQTSNCARRVCARSRTPVTRPWTDKSTESVNKITKNLNWEGKRREYNAKPHRTVLQSNHNLISFQRQVRQLRTGCSSMLDMIVSIMEQVKVDEMAPSVDRSQGKSRRCERNVPKQGRRCGRAPVFAIPNDGKQPSGGNRGTGGPYWAVPLLQHRFTHLKKFCWGGFTSCGERSQRTGQTTRSSFVTSFPALRLVFPASSSTVYGIL
jgi:hypothetical protein